MKYAILAVFMTTAGMFAKVPLVQSTAQMVDVCIEDGVPGFATLGKARAIAQRIFEQAEVRLNWHAPRECPPGAVVVDLRRSRPDDNPGALGYAKPVEGIHVVVLFDRIEAAVHAGRVSALLAYVLAHEFGHILQGVAGHSTDGIMKAHWSIVDLELIALGRLGFERKDIELIQLGIKARAFRLAARGC